MTVKLFPMNDQVNMHVNPTEMHVNGEDEEQLPRELTETDLVSQKAAVRALLVTRLERIWRACEPHIDDSVGTGADVRMTELALKVIDRLAKLHEVTEPDRGQVLGGDEQTITQVRRQEILAGLTERRAHLDGEVA